MDVHHHHVSGSQRRAEHMPDISVENIAVGRLFDGHGGKNAAGADGTQNGQDFPLASRRSFLDAPTFQTAAIEPCYEVVTPLSSR